MLFETLFLSECFLLGKTQHNDKGVVLSVNKSDLSDDEVLLFFDIDDQTIHNCNLTDGNQHKKKIRRLFWGEQEEHSLCDLLVFYAKGNEKVFCFVELKQNKADFSKAVRQVVSTRDAFKDKVIDEFKSKIKIKAYVFCANKGSSPQEHSKILNELHQKFPNNNAMESLNGQDFLDFIRGTVEKKSNKGSKRSKRK